jgi:23S rRNA (cytidine1920-2'-O)/16S rRNA (cytidine1409-2'-O)-methyltransferase
MSSQPGPEPARESVCPYVGRGGTKLRHALDTFRIDPRGLMCADFGANVGGFTDCLLQAGALRVFAIDTGYGTLAWKLRNDPRVVVMERTNALHTLPPQSATGGLSGEAAPASAPPPMDLIAIDLGWTPQRHAIPAALRWLKPAGRIISLIKPHYELLENERSLLNRGVLAEPDAERIAQRAAEQLPSLGARLLGLTRSPILGGASKKHSRGNAEWLALVAPAAS